MITPPNHLRTGRLILRPFVKSDAGVLLKAAIETHKGLYEWYSGTLVMPNINLAQVESYIEECAQEFQKGSFFQYGAFDSKDNRLLGVGSLHHIDWTVPKGRIGYWVNKVEEGHGYATEIAHIMTVIAFDKLKFERLEIRTETKNFASAAVARKLGYKFLTVFEKNKRGNDGNLWNLEIHVRFNSDSLPPIDLVIS